jgi:transcription antitermination factor NusG
MWNSKRQIQKMQHKRWYAVYTYFRREKSAIAALKKEGIDCFIPLIQKSKRYERKIKHYQIPLINHYIFVHIAENEFGRVLKNRDVIRFISLGNKPSPIPTEEIEVLKRISGESCLRDVKHRQPSKVGQEVEILSGNLAGLKGRLLALKNSNQVLIDLNHIGYSIHLEINISDLSLIPEKRLMERIS